jgi:electron transfer flavoprotein beta subunit
MKIVVLIKEVPDTYGDRRLDLKTGLLDRESDDQVVDEIDERALEVALQFKDANKDVEVVVMSLGPRSTVNSLRKGLAMGADRAVHVSDAAFAGADMLLTAQALTEALLIEGFDLVLTGNESTDGRGGIVPAMLAELLELPLLGSLSSIDISDGSVRGVRATAAKTVTLSSPLPAVVSVTEKSADARFPNFKGIMSAKRKPLVVLGKADLAMASHVATSTMVSIAERPARSSGTKIVDEGDSGTKIVEFLRERKAI